MSYLSDFSSEIYRLSETDQPMSRGALDQYFRRLQAHGVRRLITWLGPFPFVNDPDNYSAADWARFEQQARAIIDSDKLDRIIEESGSRSWKWIRQCMAVRMQRDFGQLLSDSAADHGITLIVSFRPFEAAVSTYWEVPAFDADGKFLWGFLPFAAPDINYHPDRVGFAHYRKILELMGRPDAARINRMELIQSGDPARFLQRFRDRKDNLRIVASHLPPLQEDSLVLQRDEGGRFQLIEYEQIRDQVRSHDRVMTDYEVEINQAGHLVIHHLQVPMDYRFLMISNPAGAPEALEIKTGHPVNLYADGGNRLGRFNYYWVLNETSEQHRLTRQAGVPSDGKWHLGREVTAASRQLLSNAGEYLPLQNRELIIDLGASWSVEILDLNQDAARKRVMAELQTILAYPAFDEILINTRSHTALGGQIHLAYAPRSIAEQPALQKIGSGEENIELITFGAAGEWQGQCQSSDCPYPWRYSGHVACAQGVRRLLEDIETALPDTAIRAMILPRAETVQAIQHGLEQMPRPEGGVYGQAYYNSIIPGWNLHHVLGDTMAMLDLSGLSVEPVLMGIHTVPEPGPLALYLQACLAGLSDYRGSNYRGPMSIFYEAHPVIREGGEPAHRQRFEEITCQLLSRPEIDEVILYESAAWTYRLPLSDPELCGHGFLDRCPQILQEQESSASGAVE